jgi:SulP family sulfate permease
MTSPITADHVAVRRGTAQDSSRTASPHAHPDLAPPVQTRAAAPRHRGRCSRRRPCDPQSLGYASIAGVPVQVGLYAVPLALLVYAALGTSPQLIVGPVSTVSVLSASLVASLQPISVAQAVAYTSAIALAAGVILILAGVLRVGWVAEFLNKRIVTGFVFGLTILVIIGELPNLLGIPVTPGDVLHRISLLLRNITQIDLLTATVGVLALAVLFIGQRLLPRMP